MPKITVLMPIYNAAEYLGETLASLKAQTFDDFDILIINDGSTDDWENVVDRAGMKNIRVHNQENIGLVATLNKGLNMIDSPYLARADGDDIYFPNRLAAQMDLMEFADLDVTAPRVINIDDHGEVLNLSMEAVDFHKQDPYALPPKEPYLQHPFILARTEVWQELGIRNAHLSEDADLCWRLYERFRVHMSSDVLGKYRIHTGSVSSGSVGKARVQAFYAVMSALNAQRRRSSKGEVEYLGDLDSAIGRARCLRELLFPYENELTETERAWVLAASSAKLLDLGTWRSFRLTEDDIDEAKRNFRKFKIKDPITREKLRATAQLAIQRMRRTSWGDEESEVAFLSRIWAKRPIL